MTDITKYKSVAVKKEAYELANEVKAKVPELQHLSMGGLILFLVDRFEQDVNNGRYKQNS